MLYTGGYYLLGGTEGLISALKNAAVHKALFAGGIASLLVSMLYFGIKGTISGPNGSKKCQSWF